jgi:hypothetical protein
MICDECETVAHCLKNGCVPKQPPSNQQTALRLALEALTPFSTPNWAGTGVDKANEAITVIKQALAAPVQEPVAWMWKDMRGQDVVSLFEPRLNPIPLYTTPPAQPAPEQYTALEQALTRLQKRYGELEAKLKERT